MTHSINEKMVFALAPGEHGDAPTMIVGIPEAAWGNIRDGKTSTFDLTKVGVPVKLIIFGAKTHDDAMGALDAGMKATKTPYFDERRMNFSIQPPGQEGGGNG